MKNTGTILEKLQRQGGSWLKSMQDIAGMRIVHAGDRNDQDALVRALVELFADEARAPKVIDRRKNPSHGYRAPPEHWVSSFERASLDGFDGQLYDAEYALRDAIVQSALSLANLASVVEEAEAAAPDAPELDRYRRRVSDGLANLQEHIEGLAA